MNLTDLDEFEKGVILAIACISAVTGIHYNRLAQYMKEYLEGKGICE